MIQENTLESLKRDLESLKSDYASMIDRRTKSLASIEERVNESRARLKALQGELNDIRDGKHYK